MELTLDFLELSERGPSLVAVLPNRRSTPSTMRTRKETLERERHQYAEKLLEKLLTKDRSRSPLMKDKKEKRRFQ